MKTIWKAAAYSCGVVMGMAASAMAAGWCPLLPGGAILLGCGIGLAIALHELAALRAYERMQAERARRSAYKAAFFREVNRL